VGHDWGGVLAWAFAERHPELLDRLVILNAPHRTSMARGLRRPAQALRMSYAALLQIPLLPERVIAARDYALLRATLRALRVGAVTQDELEQYVTAARRAGGLRGPLAYYRAMGRALLRRQRGAPGRARMVEAPVLVIWGERDPVLTREVATPPPKRVPRSHVEWIPEAGHFVHLDAPERVNRLVVDFLAGARA
jgi:pimeloyl-ACP methyl ester carboxylesterase